MNDAWQDQSKEDRLKGCIFDGSFQTLGQIGCAALFGALSGFALFALVLR